ncbi:MAG: hypothetical protein M4579_004160 [Chaenotheca gracillima]|nr:MAG: hypothetical protein M4579_004160 [Chaenotheca gracillima]
MSFSPHRGRGGGPIAGNRQPSWRAHSSSTNGVELPSRSLLVELNASEIKPTSVKAGISGYKCIASYNWLNSSKPKILVPGCPPIWDPPAQSWNLKPDSGEVFIDQNAARYAAFPTEPMFRALYEMDPDLDLDDIDVVICRNSMGKLLDYVSGSIRAFDIDVEIFGDKAVFVRREHRSTEFVNGFRGFGHTFPEQYTRWDRDVKGSSSHHRVAKYEFGGLMYLLRFETDAYLPEKSDSSQEAQSWRPQAEENPDESDDLLGSGDSMTIGERRPSTGHELVVRRRGHQVDQEAAAEIKTRAAHKVIDMNGVLPRLWISQTPSLIVAYHKGGKFDDVKVHNIRDQLDAWQDLNNVNLRRLNALIRQIIDIVQDTISMKCRIRRNEGGKLQIWELDIGYKSALPEDLGLLLKEEKDFADKSESLEGLNAGG